MKVLYAREIIDIDPPTGRTTTADPYSNVLTFVVHRISLSRVKRTVLAF